MERLGPIVTDESVALDDGRHLISPTGTSSDAHGDEFEENVDESEEYVDEIDELQRAFLTSLIIEVGDTEVASLELVLGTSSDAHEVGDTEVASLELVLGTSSDAHVNESEAIVNESEEALVPGPVSLCSTLKEPSSSQPRLNAVDCDAADKDALNLSTLIEASSSQSNSTVVECDAVDEDVLNHSTMMTKIERAMNENDGDDEIVCTVFQLKEYVDAEKAKVVQEMSETQAHRVLHGLADRFKISRMQDIKSTPDVAYYRLHNQTKELDPTTRMGKIFVHERSAELCHVLEDVKEEMRVPVVKALAKRFGLVATDKVFKRAHEQSKPGLIR